VLFENRFFSGLVTGSLLGLLAGIMILPRRSIEDIDGLPGARKVGQRVTGWLKR